MPKEILFLYGDDYDFSYRITQQKGKIILVKESEVQDLEKSFYLNRKKKIQTRFSSTEFEKGIYYMTRNNILFEQNFVNNRLLYQFNKWIYLMLLIPILVVNNEFYKFSYIMKGIRDAELMIKEED